MAVTFQFVPSKTNTATASAETYKQVDNSGSATFYNTDYQNIAPSTAGMVTEVVPLPSNRKSGWVRGG